MLMLATPKMYSEPYIIAPYFEMLIKESPTADPAKHNAVPTAAMESLNLSHMTPIIGPVTIITKDNAVTIPVACSGEKPPMTMVGMPCCNMELDAITARVHDISTSQVIGLLIATLKSIPCAIFDSVWANSLSSISPILCSPFFSGYNN